MKKTVLFISLLVFTSTWANPNSVASSVAQLLKPVPDGYLAMSSNGTKVFVAGEEGIWRSTDGGTTWNLTSAKGQHWMGISSSFDGKSVAASGSGQVSTSSDFGVTWTQHHQLDGKFWGPITSSQDGVHLAVYSYVANSEIWTSNDGGSTWIHLPETKSAKSWLGLVSSPDGLKLFATRGDGVYFRSIDGGESWTQFAPTQQIVASNFHTSSDGKTLFVGDDCGFQESLDGGNIWTPLATSGAKSCSNSVYDYGDGTYVYLSTYLSARDDTGKILAKVAPYKGREISISKDGGLTWNNFAVSSVDSWYSIVENGDGSRIVASSSEGIWITTDLGTTWLKVANIDPGPWCAIASNADGSKLAAAATWGNLWTSTDGGLNWLERTGAGPQGWSSIASSADGQNLAAVVGGSHEIVGGDVWTSVDRGTSWIDNRASRKVWGKANLISNNDGSKLTIASLQVGVWTSGDSGKTWLNRHQRLGIELSIAASRSGQQIAAISPKGGVLISQNQGEIWSNQALPGRQIAKYIAMSGNGKILAVSTTTGDIWISTTGGHKWKSRTSPGPKNWTSLSLSLDGSKLIAVESSTSVWIATNSASNWLHETSGIVVPSGIFSGHTTDLGLVTNPVSVNEDGSKIFLLGRGVGLLQY